MKWIPLVFFNAQKERYGKDCKIQGSMIYYETSLFRVIQADELLGNSTEKREESGRKVKI